MRKRFAEWRQKHFEGLLPSSVSDFLIYRIFAEIDRAASQGELDHFHPIPGGGMEQMRTMGGDRSPRFLLYVQSKDSSLSVAAGMTPRLDPKRGTNGPRPPAHPGSGDRGEGQEQVADDEDEDYSGDESEECPSDSESVP